MSTDVSILIPFRADTSHRSDIRAWQYGYLNVTYPDVPIIVASDNLPADKPFNRSAALNNARAKATTDWLWVLDTDTAPEPDDLPIALAAAGDHGWIDPYAGVLELDEVGTRFLLDGRRNHPHDWNTHTRKQPAHGLPLIHTDIWDDIGGLDTGYTGWGYEDIAQHQALATLHPPIIPPPIEWVRTLHHPRPDHTARQTLLNADRYVQQYMPANGNPILMRRTIDATRNLHPTQ